MKGMSNTNELQYHWKRPVTFHVTHRNFCSCSDGAESADYYLLISDVEYLLMPTDLEELKRTMPVLGLYEKELQSLSDVISDAFSRTTDNFSPSLETESNTRNADGTENNAISFDLIRNVNGQLGEYSLHVVGRGVDDILPVDGIGLQTLIEQVRDLDSLVQEVAEMEGWYEEKSRRLAKRATRERHVRSRVFGKTLDAIVEEVRRVNPYLFFDESDTCIVRVLLAAAFFVGPDIDRLVSFTGYSRELISDISCRMNDSGLWTGATACVEHWFDGNLEWTEHGLQLDCCVAAGDMVACHYGMDEAWTYRDTGRRWIQ
jgi:hypothetical protein